MDNVQKAYALWVGCHTAGSRAHTAEFASFFETHLSPLATCFLLLETCVLGTTAVIQSIDECFAQRLVCCSVSDGFGGGRDR